MLLLSDGNTVTPNTRPPRSPTRQSITPHSLPLLILTLALLYSHALAQTQLDLSDVAGKELYVYKLENVYDTGGHCYKISLVRLEARAWERSKHVCGDLLMSGEVRTCG